MNRAVSPFIPSLIEPGANPGPRLLIVEDDLIVASHLQEMLLRLGYSVVGMAESGEQALKQIEACIPDLILMDVQIKGELDGIETAKRVPDHLDIPIIYLSAHSDDPTLNRAGTTIPSGFLIKPVQERLLHANITAALMRCSRPKPPKRYSQPSGKITLCS